jgi:Protein of unknown function (DUF3485)
MIRQLLLSLGILVLLAGGLLHGMWTERWQRSPILESAVARMRDLPDDIGPWKGRPAEQDPDALAMAGAMGHWSRNFVHANTGEEVLVIVLCGRPGQMSAHRPEHCFTSAGFEMNSPALHYQLDNPSTEFWTAPFHKEESNGPVNLRIFWSWLGSSGWEAPANPRWTFSRERALYKLYVIRASAGMTPLTSDPSTGFLAELLPVLNHHLIP